MRSKVTLHIFYGIPCVGKSTTALRFANEQRIRTVIHTDYVREVQRGYASLEDTPILAKVTHNAWELFGPPTVENIITGFIAHAEAVLPALQIVVSKLARDGFSAIIEGAHFHSDLMERLLINAEDVEIRPTLLAVKDKDRLLAHIKTKEETRAQIGESKAWQSRAETMMIIQDFLATDAQKHHIPTVWVA